MNSDIILSLVVTETVYCADYEWHGMAQRLQDPKHGETAIETMAEKTKWVSAMKQMMPTIAPEVLNDFYRVYETTESRKVALELYRSGDLKALVNHRGALKQMIKSKHLYFFMLLLAAGFIVYVTYTNFIYDPKATAFLSRKIDVTRLIDIPTWLNIMYVHVIFACIAMVTEIVIRTIHKPANRYVTGPTITGG